MTSAPTDRELIRRLCDGDLAALGTLYDRYRLPVFHTALAVTHDRQAAEDILQECFLKLNSYAPRIDVSLPLEPWLYRVTVNLSYTWVSRRSRWLVSLESVIDKLVSPARAGAEYQAEMSEFQAVLRRAIDSLPASQRMTVILYYLNDLRLERDLLCAGLSGGHREVAAALWPRTSQAMPGCLSRCAAAAAGRPPSWSLSSEI